MATATPCELPPIARERRAHAPDATAPAEWDFRWSSVATAPAVPRHTTAFGSKPGAAHFFERLSIVLVLVAGFASGSAADLGSSGPRDAVGASGTDRRVIEGVAIDVAHAW